MNETSTYTVVKAFKCFATNGKHQPTNCYYGASRIYKTRFNEIDVPVGTKIHSMPGGTWLEIDGKLMGFSLDKRNPNDVNPFEKHRDPTSYVWQQMIKDGSVEHMGFCDMVRFTPMHKVYIGY